MKRNRYLEDIGIKRNFYEKNYLLKDKYSLKCFLERRHYGFDFIDILSFDFTVYKSIYSHLAMFIEYCNDCHPEGTHCAPNLSFNSVEFEGRTYTVGEAVEEIMDILKDYLQTFQREESSSGYLITEEQRTSLKRVLHLFIEILEYIWL